MAQPKNDKKKKETKTSCSATSQKNSSRISKRVSNRRKGCIKMENLECINDALSFHPNFGLQGSWKLVPKDSCEVYKDRKRRDNKKTREKESGRKNSKREQGRRKPSSDGDVTDEDSHHSREKPVRATKKTKKTKAKRGRKKSLKRPPNHESVTSYSETTMSSMYSSDTDC